MDTLIHVSHRHPYLHLSPPHPPYNPLHPASRFIVYFMIITPLTPHHTTFLGLFLTPPRVLFSFRLSIASSHLFFMTRGTKLTIGTHIATPGGSDYFRFQFHTPSFLLTCALPPPQRYASHPSIYLSSWIC